MPPEQSKLTVITVSLAVANAFVADQHRHHRPVPGHKFSLGVVDEARALRGVAIVGRPVARHRDDGWTLEVTRVATDGCANACSALYGACWRATRALGYQRLGTYTLATEPGTSLRAAGWVLIGQRGGGRWSCPSRPANDRYPLGPKLLWEAPGPAGKNADAGPVPETGAG